MQHTLLFGTRIVSLALVRPKSEIGWSPTPENSRVSNLLKSVTAAGLPRLIQSAPLLSSVHTGGRLQKRRTGQWYVTLQCPARFPTTTVTLRSLLTSMSRMTTRGASLKRGCLDALTLRMYTNLVEPALLLFYSIIIAT